MTRTYSQRAACPLHCLSPASGLAVPLYDNPLEGNRE